LPGTFRHSICMQGVWMQSICMQGVWMHRHLYARQAVGR
jgi:hypothetical protein